MVVVTSVIHVRWDSRKEAQYTGAVKTYVTRHVYCSQEHVWFVKGADEQGKYI
jgi:hypothetical protein